MLKRKSDYLDESTMEMYLQSVIRLSRYILPGAGFKSTRPFHSGPESGSEPRCFSCSWGRGCPDIFQICTYSLFLGMADTLYTRYVCMGYLLTDPWISFGSLRTLPESRTEIDASYIGWSLLPI